MMISNEKASIYAIDFGTSNTVISRWNPVTQSPETLFLPGLSQQIGDNPPLIPSLVYVEDAAQKQILAGQQVRDRGLDLPHNPRFWRNFKRGIGTEIQGFLPELDGENITFEKIGTWFLETILKSLQSEPIESLILTVPVDSFEVYRHWLSSIGQSLNVDKIRILDEPTAAALGYDTLTKKLLLVLDFGGGTVDLSLVRLDWGSGQTLQKPLGLILKWGEKNLSKSGSQKVKTARVLAKAGEMLGGSDLDNWLLDYFHQTQNLPKTSLTNRLVERLKIELSRHNEATEVYFNDQTLETYELTLDRATFKEILTKHHFFSQLDELITYILQQGRLQGIEIEDIEKVLLVGGTSQIPAVQEWISQYFPLAKIESQKPFEAIAVGALQLTQGLELQDFLYHSYGVRYWNRQQNRHSWHPIIKAGQPYPMNEPTELILGASVDNQPSIELIIGELGNETSGKTEVYFEGDRLITRTLDSSIPQVQPLNDRDGARSIAQLNPPGYPGSDRLKLQFRVDQHRFLCLTVEDLLTQKLLLDNKPLVQLQ